jgi:hypothetical protein
MQKRKDHTWRSDVCDDDDGDTRIEREMLEM